MNKPQCRKCGSPRTTRRERKTLLEKTLLTWMGIYPWECNSCWKTVLSPHRGSRRKRDSSTLTPEFPTTSRAKNSRSSNPMAGD